MLGDDLRDKSSGVNGSGMTADSFIKTASTRVLVNHQGTNESNARTGFMQLA